MVAQLPAGNNVVPGYSHFPNGTFSYAGHNLHDWPNEIPMYGLFGDLVFNVPGLTGMALHAGRLGPESKTHGCIRTTNEAMLLILILDSYDPLTYITVK